MFTRQRKPTTAQTKAAPAAPGRARQRNDAIHLPAWTSALTLRPKLTVTQPGDVFEQDADRAAERVMRMPEPALQREPCANCPDDEQPVQRKEHGGTTTIQAPDSVHHAINRPGQPLDSGTRAFMEPRFGQDFSAVRVHADAEAAQSAVDVSARAYTVGQNIVFGAGEYAPGSGEGMRLLAHELAHTVQDPNREVLRSKQDNEESSDQPIISERPNHTRRHREQSPEAIWENDNPMGFVETLNDDHFILWNFGVGERDLKPEFKEVLDQIAKRWPIDNLAGSARIAIEGHASSSGPERNNRRLSWRRAVAVKSYLFVSPVNIPPERMEVKALSHSQPRFPNISPSGMARNRRVEIRIMRPYSPTPTKKPTLEPPAPEPAPKPDKTQLGDLLPGGEWKIAYELPDGKIPLGPMVILYPGGEISGNFKIKTKNPNTLRVDWKSGKWGATFKHEIAEKVQFKMEAAGNIGVEFDNIPLAKFEIAVQLLKLHKPITFNIVKKVPVSELYLGEGISASGEVEFKLKLQFGPGPGAVAAFGTAGVVVGGTALATLAFLYGFQEMITAAHESGIAHGHQVTERNAYAWRIASETGGYEEYRDWIETIKQTSRDVYQAAYAGWATADRGLAALTSADKKRLFDLLKKRYGNSVRRLQDGVFQLVGGLDKDEKPLPKTPLELIR